MPECVCAAVVGRSYNRSRGTGWTWPVKRGRPDGSVAGNTWVDERRPGIDPTGQIVDVSDALLLEIQGNLQTARTVMADAHHRSADIDLGISCDHLIHRDVNRSWQGSAFYFPWLPDIEQQRSFDFIVADPGFEFVNG